MRPGWGPEQEPRTKIQAPPSSISRKVPCRKATIEIVKQITDPKAGKAPKIVSVQSTVAYL